MDSLTVDDVSSAVYISKRTPSDRVQSVSMRTVQYTLAMDTPKMVDVCDARSISWRVWSD